MADKETVICPETRISGEVRGEGDLVVRGRVDGKIQITETLTVEKGAVVQANVDVRVLVVSGTVVGSIVASESVTLTATARVVGDLASPRVIMEAGAAYRGKVDMGDMEAARAAVSARAAERPVSAEAPAPRSASTPSSLPGKVVAPLKASSIKLHAPHAPERPSAMRSGATAASAAPPAFPRVASATAPAWAKKKIRRR